MNWFQRVMAGRYGVDQLTIAVMVVYIILILVAQFTGVFWLSYIALVLLVFCFFRMFSRQTAKRYQENMQFLKLWNPIKSWFRFQKTRLKDSKTHRYYKCPNCSASLRVPKGKGKICITCPKCGKEFIKKT